MILDAGFLCVFVPFVSLCFYLLLGSGNAARCHHAVPSRGGIEMYPELIEGPHDDVIDHVIESLRMVVECRRRRSDHNSHPREFQHVFQMNVAEGRFPDEEHKLAALFQDDVGCPMDQIVSLSVSDSGKRSHAAGRDDHTVRDEGAARNYGALIRIGIGARGQPLYTLHRERSLMDECPRSPFAQHEVAFDAGILQHLQESNAEYRARCSGNTHYQFQSINSLRTSFLHVRSAPRFGFTHVTPPEIYAPGSRSGSASSTRT